MKDIFFYFLKLPATWIYFLNDYPTAIPGYHLDVQVAGEELFFNYALKSGVCQSMNASILMKKIGIELGNP